MSFHLRTYDINLVANGGQIEDVVGAFFVVTSAQGQFRIRTQDGLSIEPIAGDLIRKAAFTRLEFVDLSGQANNITIVAGGDPEQSPSQVELRRPRMMVNSEAAERTLRGRTFGAPVTLTPTAGNYPIVELLNPAAGKKVLIVQGVRLLASAACNVGVNNAAGVGGAVQSYGTSKRAGFPNTLNDSGAYTTSEQTGAAGGIAFATLDLLGVGTTLQSYTFDEPIVVTPGWRLRLHGDVINATLSGAFLWSEL